jgi:hypothetical protein
LRFCPRWPALLADGCVVVDDEDEEEDEEEKDVEDDVGTIIFLAAAAFFMVRKVNETRVPRDMALPPTTSVFRRAMECVHSYRAGPLIDKALHGGKYRSCDFSFFANVMTVPDEQDTLQTVSPKCFV